MSEPVEAKAQKTRLVSLELSTIAELREQLNAEADAAGLPKRPPNQPTPDTEHP